MTYNNKGNEFINWLCGVEGARFPYFRNMPKIPEVIILNEDEQTREGLNYYIEEGLLTEDEATRLEEAGEAKRWLEKHDRDDL